MESELYICNDVIGATDSVGVFTLISLFSLLNLGWSVAADKFRRVPQVVRGEMSSNQMRICLYCNKSNHQIFTKTKC